ncbi:hypothetical protein GGR56DRAFT_674484 [Xylariaceae sp. FL0804]|nr:hypothetical protein GGR56DRAFT_674484 [Xylariaceae sp. FL0804]
MIEYAHSMQHYLGTPTDAPWAFGGASRASRTRSTTYVLLAPMDWVENGQPVDQVIATTWTEAAKATSGGDQYNATSWSCG